MLTPEYCISYIKKRLGVPFTPFELDDNELTFWLESTVSQFSKFIPYKTTVTLTNEHASSTEANVFIIPDVKVISVLNVYTTINNMLISGHPYSIFPNRDLGYATSFYANVDMATIAHRNSMFYFTYEFLPPDKIRITSSTSIITGQRYIVEVEAEHALSLRTLQPEWEYVFLKMYTMNVCRILATIRSTYRTYSTQFGDIELNPEALETMADRINEEINQVFENYNPGVVVVRG